MVNVSKPGSMEFAKIAFIGRSLDDAETFGEVLQVRDAAVLAETFAKSARLGMKAENRAAEIKLRAEHVAGQILLSFLEGGEHGATDRIDPTLALDQLGIPKEQASLWKREGGVSEVLLEQYLESADTQGYEPTSAGLLQFAKQCSLESFQSAAHLGESLEEEPRGDLDSAKRRFLREFGLRLKLLSEALDDFFKKSDDGTESSERQTVAHLLAKIGEGLEELQGGCSDAPL